MKSWHILNIVNRLLNHKRVCIKAYSTEYGRSIRSIQRDFESIKEFYESHLVKLDGDCYEMGNVEELVKLINTKDELKSFIDLFYLINPSVYDKLERQKQKLVNKLYKKSSNYLLFKHSPFESNISSSLISKLKNAITHRQYIDMLYDNGESFHFTHIKPLKITFFEGNWYLAVIDSSFKINNGFRWLRISFIKEVSLHKETFIADSDAINFASNAQTLFSGYKKQSYEVKLKIDPSIARFFTTKKHLKSQKVLQKDDDGSLIVSFEISNELEILPLVKKWLPLINILSPSHLQKKLHQDLTQALKQIESK